MAGVACVGYADQVPVAGGEVAAVYVSAFAPGVVAVSFGDPTGAVAYCDDAA